MRTFLWSHIVQLITYCKTVIDYSSTDLLEYLIRVKYFAKLLLEWVFIYYIIDLYIHKVYCFPNSHTALGKLLLTSERVWTRASLDVMHS